MENNSIKFDKDTPAIVAANKVQSLMAVNKDTGEVGNVEFPLLVQEAGKHVADAVKVTGDVLPTLGDANKRYSFTTGSAGRTLTHGATSLVYGANKQCSAFWDGVTKVWSKEDEVELPEAEVKKTTLVGIDSAFEYDELDISPYLMPNTWILANGGTGSSGAQDYQLYYKIPLEANIPYTVKLGGRDSNKNTYYYIYNATGTFVARTPYSADFDIKLTNGGFLSIQKKSTDVSLPFDDPITILKPSENTLTEFKLKDLFVHGENEGDKIPLNIDNTVVVKAKPIYAPVNLSSYLMPNTWILEDGDTGGSGAQDYQLYYKIPFEANKYNYVKLGGRNEEKNTYYYIYNSDGDMLFRVKYLTDFDFQYDFNGFISIQKKTLTFNDNISVYQTVEPITDTYKVSDLRVIIGDDLKEFEIEQNQNIDIDAINVNPEFAFSSNVGYVQHKQNPVLVDGSFARDCSVIYDGVNFHCWYWRNSDIAYAKSTNGVNWTKVKSVKTSAGRPCVVLKSGVYYMYYFYNFKFYRLTFTDPEGTYSAATEVMTASLSWEGGQMWSPWVIYDNEESIWKMWYTANFVQPVGLSWTEPKNCGYATSVDGVTWIKNNDPLILPKADLSFAHSAIMTLHPIKLSGIYYAILSCGDVVGNSRVAIVSSVDGLTWDIDRKSLSINLGNYDTWNSGDMYTGCIVPYYGQWYIYVNGRNFNNSNVESTGLYIAGKPTELNASNWTITRVDNTVTKPIYTIEANKLIVNNQFTGTYTQFAPIFCNKVFEDFDIEVDFEYKIKDANTGIAIDLHNQGRPNKTLFRGISFEIVNNVCQLIKYNDNTATILKTNSFIPFFGSKVSVKIKSIDNTYTVYVNNILCIYHTDNSYVSGLIGLRAWKGVINVNQFNSNSL